MTTSPLSTADKVLRLALSTYPPQLDLSQFYPALSTYRVERIFEYAEIEKAVGKFLSGNPLFNKCFITEWEFDSADDFPLSSFQDALRREYPNYFDGFMIASVTFTDDPHAQSIFTAFPISLLDGYRCFQFHQTLMGSLKSQSDEFRVAEQLEAHGIRPEELVTYLPEQDPAPTAGANSTIPFDTGEHVGEVRKIGQYLDTVRTHFLEKSSENLFILKNALAKTRLPVGNSLLFVHVPLSVIQQGDGQAIHEHSKAKAAELLRGIDLLEQREDFATAGRALIPGIISHPHRYVVNNYGDVSAYDGSASAPEKATLVGFKWYMPALVLGLLGGERDGVSWTVTIRDRAFNFRSL